MSSTPNSDFSLTRPVARAGRSPAPAPGTGNHTPTAYTSFPTPSQMQRDRVSSRESDAKNALEKPVGPVTPAARRSLFVSFCALLASAPALFGMCCWPSLLAAAIGGAVTEGARTLSHTLSFVFTFLVLTLLLAYSAYVTRTRAQLYTKTWQVYGPFGLLCFASLLVLADPLRHILQDGGVWDGPSSNAFRDGCGEGWGCLTPTGIVFMIVFAWTGFACLITANLWQANLIDKIRAFRLQWAEIKAEHAAQKVADREAAKAAQVEREQLAAAEIQRRSAIRPSSISFGSLHVSMTPPAIFFRQEQSNQIGYRVSPSAATATTATTAAAVARSSPASSVGSGLPSNLDASLRQASEYNAQGFSYEDTRDVAETVITTGTTSNQQQRTASPQSVSSTRSIGGTPGGALSARSADTPLDRRDERPTVAGASSPTVTDSPTSRSAASIGPGGGGFFSPLSNVALTPAHSNHAYPSPAQKDHQHHQQQQQQQHQLKTFDSTVSQLQYVPENQQLAPEESV